MKVQSILWILSIFFITNLNAQVSIGTTIPQAKFHVHDSTTTSSILLSSGNITDEGLYLLQDIMKNTLMTNSDGDITLKAGDTGLLGGELKLFKSGNIGIGQGVLASDASNTLTIAGSSPLKLMGLNTNTMIDTVLTVSKSGVVYKRTFNSLMSNFWTRDNNFLYAMGDSIGIGTSAPNAPFHVVSEDPLNVLFTSDDEKSELHFQANGVESVIGQYDLTTSASFFSGTLPAKGLSYFQGNFESISADQTEGMLFNIQNDKPIYFGTADAERMRIGGMGDLHIGAFDAAQTQLFNVNGKSFFADSLQVGDKFSGLYNNAGKLNLRGFNDLNLIAGEPYAINVQSFESGTPFAIFDMESENLTLGGTPGDEKLNVDGSALIADSLYFDNSDYRLFLNEDTLSIESRKHMKFKTDFIGDFSFFNRDSAFVHFDGSRASVGIGIKNAVQELEVKGDVLIYDTLYVGNRFNKLYTGANMHIDALTNLRLDTRANYDIEIRSDGSEYATFDAKNKRFGMGTTTPEEKIDVIGTVKADKFKMTTTPANGYVMTSDADGLASWEEVPNDGDWTVSGTDLYAGVGGTVTIGTTGIPTSKLNVQGSISMPIIRTALPTFSASLNDYTIIMDTPGSSVILPDPGASLGRVYVLKFQNSLPSSIQSLGAAATVEGMPSFPVPTSPIGGLYTTIVVQSDGVSGWWVINY